MKSQFKTDTTMILAVSVLTLGMFASAVGSMIANSGTATSNTEAVQVAVQGAKVRPVSI